MGYFFLGLLIGFVIGSLFPQPQVFTRMWEKVKAKFN